MDYTHIILNYPSSHTEILCRVTDGMLIGQRKNEVVVFGEDNKKNSRVFVDNEHASRYLRGKVAMDDLVARDVAPNGPDGTRIVVIEERDGGRGLVLPEDAMDIPREGLVRMN